MNAVKFYVNDHGPVDADQCAWYLAAPCGCRIAVAAAILGGHLQNRLTAEAAWPAFYCDESAATMCERGWKVEIGLLRDVSTVGGCTHGGVSQ